MQSENQALDPKQHERLGVELYNKAWEYLDKPNRQPLDNEMMLHCAHASCWHWLQVGTAINHARGAWILSRAYAVSGDGVAAVMFARRCLGICEENGIADFDLAYAHEAMARASSLAGDAAAFEAHLAAAKTAAQAIAQAEDKELFISDLASLPGFH